MCRGCKPRSYSLYLLSRRVAFQNKGVDRLFDSRCPPTGTVEQRADPCVGEVIVWQDKPTTGVKIQGTIRPQPLSLHYQSVPFCIKSVSPSALRWPTPGVLDSTETSDVRHPCGSNRSGLAQFPETFFWRRGTDTHSFRLPAWVDVTDAGCGPAVL